MLGTMFFGERYPTRIAADFDNAREARRAARSLAVDAGLSYRQIRVIDPNDPLVDHKLEPETSGVMRTLVRSHLVFGVAGLSLGLVVAMGLIASGAAFAVSQPAMTLVSFGAFAAVMGLLAAGFVTSCPDHQRVLVQVKQAARDGSWTVVAHVATSEQREHARDLLKRRTDEIDSTL